MLSLACVMGNGCGNKLSPAVDYSTSNTISVVLAKSPRECGLQLARWDKDGATSPTTLQGSSCHRLELAGRKEGYIYFVVDPAFKRENCSNVRVLVEYYDAVEGSFDIEYNSHDPRTGQFNAYTRSLKREYQTGTMAWQKVAFRLKNACFLNAQNGGGDFRLRVATSDFYVRQLTMVREDAVEKPVRSGTISSVSILLGHENDERGLHQVFDQGDGLTVAAVQRTRECRKLANTRNWGYIYFAIDPAFKTTNRMTAHVEVEYFDGDRGQFELQYDKTGDQNGAYTKCPNREILQGSHTWKTTSFVMRDAAFENSQNGDADFRVWSPLPELHLRQVTVRRE